MKAVGETRKKILNQMIEDKLVYQEAVAQGIEVKEEEVEKELLLIILCIGSRELFVY